MSTVHRFGKIAIFRDSRMGVLVFVGKRMFDPMCPLLPVLRAASWLRGCLPSFWAVGVHDCDTGGRVFEWSTFMAWNRWHLARIDRALDGSGDGPNTLCQITFFDYLREPRRRSA